MEKTKWIKAEWSCDGINWSIYYTLMIEESLEDSICRIKRESKGLQFRNFTIIEE